MSEAWRSVEFSEFLTSVRRKAVIDPDSTYKMVTLPLYGRGARLRKAVTGSELGTAKFEVKTGDLMISKIDARKGSNSLLPPELDGAIVTGDFLSYSVDEGVVSRDYFDVIVRSTMFADLCDTVSAGTTNRVRLDVSRFLSLAMLIPPLATQHRIVDLIGALDEAIEAADESAGAAFDTLEVARDREIWGQPGMVALADICEIKSKLVDPKTNVHSVLPHVGTERITTGTGDLVGVRSAAEDGVTSGKFLYTGEDVIYSKIRPNLRKVALPTGDGLCSADAYPIRPKSGVDRVFLKHLLISRPFTASAIVHSARTGMPKINQTDLFAILVPDVSEVEQVRLASLFSGMDQARETAASYAASLRTLRTNLLTTLLSGDHLIPATYDLELAA